jgi:parallel beta-helix repeat protein
MDNSVVNNTDFGIYMVDANYSKVYGNDFFGNELHAYSNGISNTFDSGYPAGGNYWDNYTGVDQKRGVNQDQPVSDGVGDSPYQFAENGLDRYPLVNPSYWQDAGVFDVFAKSNSSLTAFGRDYNNTIYVITTNLGSTRQIFNLTFRVNNTIIGMRTINLQKRSFDNQTFYWYGTGWQYGNCTISATISQPQSDMNTTNDENTIKSHVVLTIPGDVDCVWLKGVLRVRYTDLGILSAAYGATPSKPKWNPNCDINNNGKITYTDLGILLANYGKHYP